MPRRTLFPICNLFANRSEAIRYREAMDVAAGRAAAFVLGGDIFDFRWSTLATIEQTVEAAIEWVRYLIAPCPQCHFHYLLGNHDYHRQFIERLDQLARSAGNLRAPLLFASGRQCVPARRRGRSAMTAARLSRRRARWLHAKKRGPVRQSLLRCRGGCSAAPAAAPPGTPKWLVARRILAYLEDIGQGPDSGVEHVYFGHTHCVLSDYPYGGLTFHNAGSAIKGLSSASWRR